MNQLYTSFLYKLSLAFTLTFVITASCLGQITKKAYQIIGTKHTEIVRVNVKGASVVFKETKSNRILVEAAVRISIPNPALLDFIVQNGRYELIQTLNTTTRELFLESKENQNAILVKGKLCAEDIAYTIYVPSNIRSIQH